LFYFNIWAKVNDRKLTCHNLEEVAPDKFDQQNTASKHGDETVTAEVNNYVKLCHSLALFTSAVSDYFTDG